jgi:1,4-alpha-glucan branching enzyme
MTVFTYAIPGIPLIYSGQESGSSKRLKFFERDPIEWNNHPFFELYKKLNQLKKENEALWNPGFGGNYTRLTTGHDKQVYAALREKGTNKVLIIINFSNDEISVQLDPEIITGKYLNYFTGEKVKPASAALALNGWGYMVFTKD